jgi:hypothetical protein
MSGIGDSARACVRPGLALYTRGALRRRRLLLDERALDDVVAGLTNMR